MKRIFDISLVTLCAAFVIFCGIYVLARPAKLYSEEERRALAQKPTVSISAITSGELAKGLTELFCDQFPARRSFTSLKAKSELIMGKQENNGIIFAADGYLVTSPKYEDLSLYEKNLAAISAFCAKSEERGLCAYTFFAPRGADVLTDKLPEKYPSDELTDVWNIACGSLPELITVTDAAREKATDGEEVWFRTDHHWTHLGAYECYVALGNALGYTPLPLEYWNYECASSDFSGTVYARSGISAAARDSIYLPISTTVFTVTYHTDKKETSTLFDRKKLLGSDKYSVYLGGNFDRVSIRAAGEDRPRLTLIKDSFANSVIPYLAEHFDLEIYDLRYFKGSINEELASSGVREVLILYGIDTAITDGSLGLLER